MKKTLPVPEPTAPTPKPVVAPLTLLKATPECGTRNARREMRERRGEEEEPYLPGDDRWDEIVWFRRSA